MPPRCSDAGFPAAAAPPPPAIALELECERGPLRGAQVAARQGGEDDVLELVARGHDLHRELLEPELVRDPQPRAPSSTTPCAVTSSALNGPRRAMSARRLA